MGHLKITCDGCGESWSVYCRDNWKDWRARTCPICGRSIDSQTWARFVLRAFGEMNDANIELMKDHSQSHGTLFTVDYISDAIFPNKRRDGADLIDTIVEAIDTLKNFD